jgi:hypothetical protein
LTFQLEFTPQAIEDFSALDPAVSIRISAKLHWLSEGFDQLAPETLTVKKGTDLFSGRSLLNCEAPSSGEGIRLAENKSVPFFTKASWLAGGMPSLPLVACSPHQRR